MGQWHKRADVSEGRKPFILIRFQEGHEGVSSLSQVFQECCCHPFTIDNDASVRRFPTSLLIASQRLGQSHRQMLVSTRGGGQTRMPLLIMQKDQSTTPQDFARAAYESTRNQAVGIHGLAVAINVKTGRRFLLSILAPGFPQMGRP